MTFVYEKMAATLCVKFLPKHGWLPLIQSVRHSPKAVTRHERPIPFFKKKVLAVTEYIPPPRGFPPGAYPPVKKQDQDSMILDGLDKLHKQRLERVLENCRMIAVVQNNRCSAHDLTLIKYKLFRHGIIVKFFSNRVLFSVLGDSPYRNLLPLFMGLTALLVSKEPKVKEMLSTLKSSPQFTLLGAYVDDTLLSVQGLVRYSKLPSVTMVQGELVSGLTMLTSCTASMLHRHPAHLSALLQQYIKQQSPDSDAEPAAKSEEAT
ncbi:large ribosomal subunit protein uL10m [Austrofundulus limnaeus]|uniref:Large ribosomal subunit protein uL10m n=1 Tax=Austrofundulus limnaeus TaxID=52670 RepID=A0A2I4BR34_AUSLI|nr:PREDICTED: 39S ribosomal protein L10, mitochondrial [Austrofundulus limnaeus]